MGATLPHSTAMLLLVCMGATLPHSTVMLQLVCMRATLLYCTLLSHYSWCAWGQLYFTTLYCHAAVGAHGGNFTLPHSTATLQLVCMRATLLYCTLLSHYSWCAWEQLYFTTLLSRCSWCAWGQLYFTAIYCHTTVGMHGGNFTLPHSTVTLQLVCMEQLYFTAFYCRAAVGVHGGYFTLPHSTATRQLVCMGATLLYHTLLSHYSWCAWGQLYFTALCHTAVGVHGATLLYCILLSCCSWCAWGQLYFTALYCHTTVGMHGGNFTLPHSTVTLQLVHMGATLLYRTLLSHCSRCVCGQLYFTALYCHAAVGVHGATLLYCTLLSRCSWCAWGQLYFTALYCHTTVRMHGGNFTLPHSTITLQYWSHMQIFFPELNIIPLVHCGYNHPHTPTNAHNLYRITIIHTYELSYVFQQYITMLRETVIQRNIKN